MATLDDLGLDAAAEAVYRSMVLHPEERLDQIGLRVGLSTAELQAALDRLHELALVRPPNTATDSHRAVPPQVGIQMLLADHEAKLAVEQARIDRAKAAAARLISDLADDTTDSTRGDLPRRLVGIEEIRDYIRILCRSAVAELMTFATGGGHSASSLAQARPQDQQLLERGVRIRTIYLDSIRNHRPTFEYASWLSSIGAEVRTTALLPVRMMILDRTYAILPMVEENSAAGAVVLTGDGVLTALCALFDLVWSSAGRLDDGHVPPPNVHGFDSQTAATLRMLAQGYTDEVITRRLGASSRTIRRTASEIMEALGARSRFQAGACAAAAGWLDSTT